MMAMRCERPWRALAAAWLAVVVAGCQQAPAPLPTVPPQPGMITTVPPTPPAPPPTTLPMPVPAPAIAMPSLDFLPGPLYFCAAAGERTPIVYEPRVETLCRRHPEMGPCQYERNACRANGGRVFTGRGEEVTLTNVVVEGYDFTVKSAIAAVERVLAPEFTRTGALTPVQAFGMEFVDQVT